MGFNIASAAYRITKTLIYWAVKRERARRLMCDAEDWEPVREKERERLYLMRVTYGSV